MKGLIAGVAVLGLFGTTAYMSAESKQTDISELIERYNDCVDTARTSRDGYIAAQCSRIAD